MPKVNKKAKSAKGGAVVKLKKAKPSARFAKVKPVAAKKFKVEKREAPKAPVSKPSKPAAPPKPLTAELLAVRQRLLQMLSDLRKDIAHEVKGASERDLAHINDTSDMASDAADGDLSLRIAESETVEAGEIERAIEKLDSGTYGSCEVCNKVINAERLQFLPFATLCIKCQELAEIRKREDGDELDDLAEGTDDSENN